MKIVIPGAAPNSLSNSEFMQSLRKAWGMPFGLPATEWMLELGAFVLRSETELNFRDNGFSCPDTTQTAFAMALGAGLDIKAGRHVDVRAGQIDYLPVFFSHKREDGLRFSAGVKIK